MLSLLIFRPRHESREGCKVFQFGEVKTMILACIPLEVEKFGGHKTKW